jgi:hypothetical protein
MSRTGIIMAIMDKEKKSLAGERDWGLGDCTTEEAEEEKLTGREESERERDAVLDSLN